MRVGEQRRLGAQVVVAQVHLGHVREADQLAARQLEVVAEREGAVLHQEQLLLLELRRRVLARLRDQEGAGHADGADRRQAGKQRDAEAKGHGRKEL